MREGLPAGARFYPETVRERHVVRVPRPLLPRGDGPRGGRDPEPAARGRSPRGGEAGDPRARLGRGRAFHGLRRPGARLDRGHAGRGDGDLSSPPRDPLEAVGGEDETSGSARGSRVRQHGSPRVRVRAGGRRMSTVLREMVHALRTVTKAEAVALINRDGSLVATALREALIPPRRFVAAGPWSSG